MKSSLLVQGFLVAQDSGMPINGFLRSVKSLKLQFGVNVPFGKGSMVKILSHCKS